MHQRALFIFRRDLRLQDNTGLNAARSQSKEVLPCFILNPEQLNGPYAGKNSIQFMTASLRELQSDCAAQGGVLLIEQGVPVDVLRRLIHNYHIDAVYVNRDYTPYSRQRDLQLQHLCDELHVPFIAHPDALLHEPEEVTKSDGSPYTVFTPFWNRAMTLAVRPPETLAAGRFAQVAHAHAALPELEVHSRLALQGGRREALRLLADMRRHATYEGQRDFPAIAGTTMLSAHLKFGTVSVREAYAAVASELGEHALLRQLYWRDFFSHIAYHFPKVFGHAFHHQYDKIAWSKDRSHLDAWKDGRTGFPIVDAGMRELVATGYMHNRVRMITASFLVKDLHIDWREGERFFAQHLIDYDPSLNNGNWQWAASTGCDAQPYFRIFNPWLQQQRFDPECKYIKRWVPELAELSPKAIHSLADQQPLGCNYPRPIVEHRAESEKAKAAFSLVKSM